MEDGFYRRIGTRKIGPGGWKCACCHPRGKNKKTLKRQARKALKRMLERTHLEQLIGAKQNSSPKKTLRLTAWADTL